MNVHLPSLITAIIALVCACGTVLMFHSKQKDLARARWQRRRDLAVLAEWVDSTAGTFDVPAPGSVAFYTLFPLEQWPADYFPPNSRMDGKCPLPEHDLRVVVPYTGGRAVWSATCQCCAAHWTANDAPPPVVVARQIQEKLAALPAARR